MNVPAADLADLIVRRARELGATLAGVVQLEDLSSSPSYRTRAAIGPFGGVGSAEWADSSDAATAPDPPSIHRGGARAWPPAARSVAVLALAHQPNGPELDWWGVEGGTRGNRALIAIAAGLKESLARDPGIQAWEASYYPDQGGAFLKDAAVLAGLGVIGRNNLLLTPEFGPRVRLRMLFLEADLPSTGRMSFAPCEACEAPCRRLCPERAFSSPRYSAIQIGFTGVPGTDGSYDRELCNLRMTLDEERAALPAASAGPALVRYCRRCELSCPVGRVGRQLSPDRD